MPLFKGTAGKAKPKKAIDYITDPKKAAIVSSFAMDDNVDYAKQFAETCKLYGKGNGYSERKYYHFKLLPDRADNAMPEQCHALAERMARELFSAHECVIATHNDTDTTHSHIIINAVSFETGKKFHMNIGEYQKSKDLADILGAEMGFTPLDWRTKTAEKLERIHADGEINSDKKYLSSAEIQIAKRNKKGGARLDSNSSETEILSRTSWKEALRQAIDEAKAYCTNRTEFQRYLQNNFGVTMPRNTGKTVSFVHPAVGKNYAIRGNKLGGDYTATSIDQALQENAERTLTNEERSLPNARLFIAEEQFATTSTATPAPTNPISNNPTFNSQPTIQAGNRERPTPRSISDIGAELRSIDSTVERIARGVSAAGEGGNNNMATKSHDNEQFHEKTARRNDGGSGKIRTIKPTTNTPIQSVKPTATKPIQPKSPEPAIKATEHERSVQQKPKRRSSYNDR
ncbi:MAG: relaxase/mobilization nuclease domain-containing protein [Defluviitaleaceae bacterium]|nr:relaxase/mobilization nuclease domain-containing protein [Defluviitaleaceae bacterium]